MEQSLPAEDLVWTGERLVTTCHRPLVYEHLHRYAVAFGLAKGKSVLDIACGEGYGANLLARTALKVIGVDRDAGTIGHARTKYRRRNLHFVQGSCTEIPCEDHSIDLVASFETIEHISRHDAFLSEIKRVLVPGGILVISSPHKAEYQKVSETANPFHEAELDHDEFVQLITKTFKHYVAAKQRLVIGSWIAPDAPSPRVSAATFRGWFDGIEIESGIYRGLYSIAICSDQALPVFSLGMFENFRDSADTWNLLDTCDTPAQLSSRLIELSQLVDEKAKQVLHFQRESHHKSQLLERLKSQLETSHEALARAKEELLDARWEALTLRGTLASKTDLVEMPSSRLLELENRIETTTSERDQLRTMLVSLQSDLEQERRMGQAQQSEFHATQAQLTKMAKDLQSEQKQMDRLRESILGRLILPFGKSQKKLRQLTSRRAND